MLWSGQGEPYREGGALGTAQSWEMQKKHEMKSILSTVPREKIRREECRIILIQCSQMENVSLKLMKYVLAIQNQKIIQQFGLEGTFKYHLAPTPLP